MRTRGGKTRSEHRAYELMIIVDGDHDDETVDQIVTQVDTWVQGENGSLGN